MNVQRMPASTRDGGQMRVVLPDVHLLRREADTANQAHAWADECRVVAKGNKGSQRLDGVRAQRAGNPVIGGRADGRSAYWPGCGFGVRAPQVGETPLSEGEWQFLFRGDL